MTLLSVGIDHHQTEIAVREQLYASDAQIGLLLDRLRGLPGLSESIVLSTCNRLEVYALVDSAVDDAALDWIDDVLVSCLSAFFHLPAETLRHALYVRRDDVAVTHLLRVAAGLESMIVGEAQILGQVRHALDVAEQVATGGRTLHRLFMAAIHAGKRARAETHINRGSLSIGQAAALMAKAALADSGSTVLVIGAGEMGALALGALVDHGVATGVGDIRLINRGTERAEHLASLYEGVTVHTWAERRAQIAEADAVIVATGAHQPVIHLFDLDGKRDAERAKPLLLIDIAVPRNVDEAVRGLPGVTYRDIDDIRQVVDAGLQARLACVPQVERIVAEESAEFNAWLATREVIPTLKDLRDKIETLVNREFEAALGKLDHLDERDKAVLQRTAHRLVNAMLHEPTTGLKRQAAGQQGNEYAAVVRELFALDVAREAG